MAENTVERKLRAILCADVKGYSRMMGDDEVGTYQTLTANLETIRSIISEHKGRVFSSPGDAVMAEFSSVVDAVECAVKMQENIEAENTDVPDHQKMQFRIGVNLGDVIHDGEQIYGDGVNIAARIETLAEPGKVAISKNVYRNIRNKLKFGYEYHGEHQVKNITEPVRVYKVLTSPEHAGQIVGEPKPPKRLSKQSYISILVVLALIAVAATWHFYPRSPIIEPALVEKMAYPLPDKPSIAVLSFDNMSDDPKQEYFSDGLSEDVITDLSKIPGLFVTSRYSSFSYKGKDVKTKKIAEELGVRYLLEGSVRRSDDLVRINAQLIDGITGHHLWAERYDGNTHDIFALQDKITRKIVTSLALKLTESEQDHLVQKETDNIEAHEAFLKGSDLADPEYLDSDRFAEAIQWLEKAIDLDPNYSRAYAAIAETYFYGRFVSLHRKLGISNRNAILRAYDYLEKALKNPTNIAHRTAAWKYLSQWQHEKAVDQAMHAIVLQPNDRISLSTAIVALSYAGRSDEAVEMVERMRRIDPACLY